MPIEELIDVRGSQRFVDLHKKRVDRHSSFGGFDAKVEGTEISIHIIVLSLITAGPSPLLQGSRS